MTGKIFILKLIYRCICCAQTEQWLQSEINTTCSFQDEVGLVRISRCKAKSQELTFLIRNRGLLPYLVYFIRPVRLWWELPSRLSLLRSVTLSHPSPVQVMEMSAGGADFNLHMVFVADIRAEATQMRSLARPAWIWRPCRLQDRLMM